MERATGRLASLPIDRRIPYPLPRKVPLKKSTSLSHLQKVESPKISSLLSSSESRFSKNVILSLVFWRWILRKCHSYSHLQKVGFLKTLSLVLSSGGRFSESIILTIASKKQALRKRYPWDCLLEVANACLFIESLSADRVGAYCIRPTKRHQR